MYKKNKKRHTIHKNNSADAGIIRQEGKNENNFLQYKAL